LKLFEPFSQLAQHYLTTRDISKAKSALGAITSNDRVHLLELDLKSLISVRKCVENFLSMSKQLDILIANAGIMATPAGKVVNNFETQFGVNHFSHFLLINLLILTLLASSSAECYSRIIILSSIAHRVGEVKFSNINLDGEYNF
jgi:NAD(P)-dependent dehydrogenase (short-subunit alcohol dehydrogenase family)